MEKKRGTTRAIRGSSLSTSDKHEESSKISSLFKYTLAATRSTSHKYYGITYRCFTTKRSVIVSKNNILLFVTEGKSGVEGVYAEITCKECKSTHVLELGRFA